MKTDTLYKKLEQAVALMPPKKKNNAGRKPLLSMVDLLWHFLKYMIDDEQSLKSYHRKNLANTISYNRLTELQKETANYFLIILALLINETRASHSKVMYIDSTRLEACHVKRAKGYENKVLKEYAQWGKSSMGWFFGFKLHMLVTEDNELAGLKIIPGNVADNSVIEELTAGYKNIEVYGDKGYLCNAEKKGELADNGILCQFENYKCLIFKK